MSTKSRKEREKEDRKELILKAAMKIMEEKGLHGLNIDLVAAETELAKGTIYLYFKSKEEILSVLTVRARMSLLKEFQKIVKKVATPIDKLKLLVKANFQHYKKDPLAYDLISLYEANHKVTETEEMYKSSDAIIQLVSGIAAEAERDGTLNKSIKPELFTMVLYGTTVGMLQLIKVRGVIMKDKMHISEQALLDCFVETLENGIKR